MEPNIIGFTISQARGSQGPTFTAAAESFPALEICKLAVGIFVSHCENCRVRQSITNPVSQSTLRKGQTHVELTSEQSLWQHREARRREHGETNRRSHHVHFGKAPSSPFFFSFKSWTRHTRSEGNGRFLVSKSRSLQVWVTACKIMHLRQAGCNVF